MMTHPVNKLATQLILQPLVAASGKILSTSISRTLDIIHNHTQTHLCDNGTFHIAIQLNKKNLHQDI